MTRIESEDAPAFRLPRELTLAVAAGIRREALASGFSGPAAIDAGGVEVIDLAGLQLMVAVARHAGAQERGAPEPCSASVAAAMKRAGFSFPKTN